MTPDDSRKIAQHMAGEKFTGLPLSTQLEIRDLIKNEAITTFSEYLIIVLNR